MHLTEIQTDWLKWLHENGGAGWLDQYGRVIANGANSKQGSQVAWLNLIVKGLVTANDQERLILTDKGRQTLRLPGEIND